MVLRVHYPDPDQQTHHAWEQRSPTHTPQTANVTPRGGQGRQSYGGHSERETPGPIPNPEVKPISADGTATDRLWESRTPPDIHLVEATRCGWPPRHFAHDAEEEAVAYERRDRPAAGGAPRAG